MEAAAIKFATRGFGRVSIGDVSFQHGGNIPLHQTHEVGLDVDVRPIRTAEDQCRWGVNYRWSTYDRKATRALIKDIIATAPGHITDIYFNDPVLIKEGLTTGSPVTTTTSTCAIARRPTRSANTTASPRRPRVASAGLGVELRLR